MSYLDTLEEASNQAAVPRWTGTFRDFLKLFETNEFKNLGALAHQRIYNMILDKGVEDSDYFGKKRKQYNFFEKQLFGVEDSIEHVMNYIHSAAQKTETSRRMLLLYGPPSSGKSQLVELLKRGLEQYTQQKNGAIFAVAGSKMHENPFLLVPKHLRPEFEANYGLKIEGDLSPLTSYKLENDYKGKFMDYPVEQIFLSEASRVGIGTWLPSDPKSSDQGELVGGIDFARIQEVGDEADPRAYNFNGELNVANRGIMEFVEGLKADERFLRVLLVATQEKAIKAPRFGFVYIDSFIIMHSNETEFQNFMQEKKYEAYHDRMVIVKVPYNLSVSNEVKIYQKLLGNSEATQNIHIAPKTLEAAAMFAVMSRIEPPKDGDLTIVKKMKLYDGQHVKGYKTEQVPDIKKKCSKEGMSGVSPRFVIDQICSAISIAKDEGRNFITAIDVLRQLGRAVKYRDTFKADDKNRFEQYISSSREEWNDALRKDIQKAFFVSFKDEAKALFENYLDQIDCAASGTKPVDPITGEEAEVNEKLMDAIEHHIDISGSGKEDFRNEILRYAGHVSRSKKEFDYTQHAQLREAIEKQLFEERSGVIRMTVSVRNPDPEAVRRNNELINRMVDQQGYTAEAANELLKYASAHLFDK